MSPMTTAPDRRLPARQKLRAVEIVMLAAATFDRDFTKWELAVAAWNIAPDQFGMKGFESVHPDMNRVMMEIVGSKPSNPIKRGLIENRGTCVYRITDAGKRAVAVLRNEVAGDAEGNAIYNRLERFTTHPAYLLWLSNPAEPRDFAAVRDTIGSTQSIIDVRVKIQAARDWCKARVVTSLVWSVPPARRPPITLEDLSNLDDFLTAIEYRFPQLAPRRARRA